MFKKNSKKHTSESRISKLINNSNSDSDDDESEHELFYYAKDRVKLMKQVLTIIKPKKIKSMAPECLKNMEIDEINSVLLEELLGISNKRLKCIFEGKTYEGDSSSTEDEQPVDVISLDDVSEDDFIAISDEEDNKPILREHKRKKSSKHAREKTKKIKKEKSDTDKTATDRDQSKQNKKEKGNKPLDEENLMSVLELLELQARARAIRSQLTLESRNANEKNSLQRDNIDADTNNDDEDEVIIEVQTKEEILISSSAESETEQKIENINETNVNSNDDTVEKTEQVAMAIEKTTLNDAPKIANENMAKTENVEETNSKQTLINEEKDEIGSQVEVASQPDNPVESTAVTGAEFIDTQESRDVKEQVELPKSNNDSSTTEPMAEKEKTLKKAKRLKDLKNKLESYKKDVLVDSNVKILEHVVFKDGSSSQIVDDNDGLVINIDQDDLDCIICD